MGRARAPLFPRPCSLSLVHAHPLFLPPASPLSSTPPDLLSPPNHAVPAVPEHVTGRR